MHNTIIKILFFTVFILNKGYLVFAQINQPEIFCAGSGRLINANVNIDYSIGETITFTASNAINSINSGLGQPNYIITSIDNNINNTKIKVYPNPTTDFINIDISDMPNLKYTISIVDVNGKKIQYQENITKSKTKIDCQSLPIGIYIMKLETSLITEPYIFKIIKQQ